MKSPVSRPRMDHITTPRLATSSTGATMADASPGASRRLDHKAVNRTEDRPVIPPNTQPATMGGRPVARKPD